MTGSTVLIVEDDGAIAELERRALERAGYASVISHGIDAACAELAKQPFDAVLLDYNLPEGEPWAVVELARSRLPRVPVVLVTAVGNEHVVSEALYRGVGDTIRKSAQFLGELGRVVGRVATLARAEDRLRRSGTLFQLLADHGDDMIITLDPAGLIRYASAASRRILGRDMKDLVGVSIREFVHDDDVEAILATDRGPDAALHHRVIFRSRHADEREVWVEANLQHVLDQRTGAVVEIVGMARDVSARVNAQFKVEAALREKTVLLNEVHHRVKNNLQIIISLLGLQREHSVESGVQQVLLESEARVRAMALIHQFLYERKEFSRVDLVDYLDQLGRLVDGVNRGRQRGIVLEVTGPTAQLWLAFDQAVPCGLLVNELLSNAFKHAFPDRRKGAIRLQVEGPVEGRVRLSVADTGVGLPPGFDLGDTSTLGLQLADILVDQLEGQWNVTPVKAGTRIDVGFPYRAAERAAPR